MILIEIKSLSNGSHRNCIIFGKKTLQVPEGWAIVPEDMKLENFPFGEVVAESKNGIMTVVEWIKGVKYTSTSSPVLEKEKIGQEGISTKDVLNTLLGVNENG